MVTADFGAFPRLRLKTKPEQPRERIVVFEGGWGGNQVMFKGKYRKILIIIAVIAVVWLLAKANQAPRSGSSGSVGGGQLTLNTTEFPKSFNYFVNNTVDASIVFNLVYDTLLSIDDQTLKFKPLIAKTWTISSDKKVFTFTIDPKAKWADGKPITTADVKFTYDTVMNPKNLTSVQRMLLARFAEPEVIDGANIKFTAKTVHYNNLVALASLNVLPQHLFAGKDFNKAFNMSLPEGSGPYVLNEVKEDRYYVLKRRPDYWAAHFPDHRGMYNFAKVKFKKVDENMAFEAFKKGDFDIYTGVSAKRWVTETNSEPFKKNWIVKQKVFNYAPQGFSGLVFNMRRPPFNDLRIRQAIFNLMDRKTLLQKIMYNEYQPLNSYFPSLYTGQSANPSVNYNPVKAKQLLAEAGYTKLDKDGYLVNAAGQRLEFTINYNGESFEKHLTMMTDTWKRAGVKVNLNLMSWPTWLKQMSEYKFDAAVAVWGATLFDDPEQLWHSKHASENGGSNYPGYQNPKVDRLIESLPPIFDVAQRNKIIKQIDGIVYQDTPYALLWGANYTRVLYKNIFAMPKTILSKYGNDESNIIAYWRVDPVKLKKYNEALKRKTALPGVPVEAHYDQLASKPTDSAEKH
jgi:microcin C transport system substrate-binding protein